MNRKIQWLAAIAMAGSLGVGAAQAAPECNMIGPWLGGGAVNAYTYRTACNTGSCSSFNQGFMTSSFDNCGWSGRRVLIKQPRMVQRTIITQQPEIVAERIERLAPVAERVTTSVKRYKIVGFQRVKRIATYKKGCAPALEAVASCDSGLAPVAERVITRTTTLTPAYSSFNNGLLCP